MRNTTQTSRFGYGTSLMVSALFAVLASSVGRAADGTWTNTSSGGLWSDTANWTNGMVADGSGSTANFNMLNISDDPTVVHLDTPRTIGNLIFGDTTTSSAASWTVGDNGAPSNVLTLDGVASTLTVNPLGTGKTVTLGLVLSGSKLIKRGNGALILSGLNTYSDGLELGNNGGSVTLLNDQTGATGSLLVNTNNSGGNGSLNIGSASQVAPTRVHVAAPNHVQVSSLSVNTSYQTLNTAGAVGHPTVVTNDGTLLTGRSSGTTIGAHSTWVQNSNLTVQAFGGYVATLNVSSGGALIYNGTSRISLVPGVNSSGSAVLNLTGGSLTTSQGFNYSPPPSGSGQARVRLYDGGTLVLSDNIADLTTGDTVFSRFLIGTNATIDTAGFSTTLATPIDNISGQTGSLIKSGAGTLQLNAWNSYTGPTLISAGTLALGASGALQSPDLRLSNNSTLDVSAVGTFTLGGSQSLSGSGTVVGTVYDSFGSQLNPGGVGAVGTLTFTSDLYLAGGDTVNCDFSGGSNDLISVGGTLTPNGITTINLANWPTPTGFPVGDYVLMQATSLGGSTSSFTLVNVPGRQAASISLVYDTLSAPQQVILRVSSLASVANLLWQGGLNVNAWDVQTTANWLNGITPDTFYQSDNVLFSNVAPANASVNLMADVAPGAITFVGTNDYSVSSFGYKITGAASLTQDGSGTVTLNTASDYSGGTTINSGAIQLGDGSLYAGSVAGEITNNASLIVANPYDLEFGTTVSGPGQLVKTGTSTLTLTNAQPYTGGTVISAGTLQLGNGGAAGSLSPDSVITNNSVLSLNRSGTTSQGSSFGRITGTGSVQHMTGGLVNLTTNNSHSGGTTLFGSGRIQVSDSQAFGFGKVYLKSSQSSFFATLSLTGGLTVTNDIEIDSTTGRENLETLSGTNTLSGNISITGAGSPTIIIQNNSGNPFYVEGDITGADFTGNVSLRGSTANSILTSTAQISLPNAVLNFNPNTGGNEWTIESTGNTWSSLTMGGTQAGKMLLGANNALATGAPVGWATGSPITLDLNGHNQTVAGLDLASTTSTPKINNGSTNSDSILTLAGLAMDYTYAGVIIDGVERKVGLVMNSAGRTQTLSGANAYSGDTTVTAGTLVLQQPTLAAMSTVGVASGALLQLDFAGAETNAVAALVLNGATQAPGVYSSNTHPAFLAGAGSLQVVPGIPSIGTNLTILSVTSSNLTLQWPEDYTGWYLQSQTNELNTGLNTNWVTVGGSESTNQVTVPIVGTNPAVFFRMVHTNTP